MTIHKEGKKIVADSFLALFCALGAYLIWGGWFLLLFLVAIVIWTGLVLNFFRSPERSFTPDPDVINCPADGKVVIVQKVFEPEYFKEERWQVSIFMSPLNVHLNRVPMTGKVRYYRYHPGKYLVAWHPKSSLLNERNTIVLEDEQGRNLLVRQIAGAVARRIVCYMKEGKTVAQGAELGFIKFGSRVDLFLPLDVEILVSVDDLVKGNVDSIARWSQK